MGSPWRTLLDKENKGDGLPLIRREKEHDWRQVEIPEIDPKWREIYTSENDKNCTPINSIACLFNA